MALGGDWRSVIATDGAHPPASPAPGFVPCAQPCHCVLPAATMTVRLLAVAMSPMIASQLAATRAAKMIAVDAVTIRMSIRRIGKDPIWMRARGKTLFAPGLRPVPVAVVPTGTTTVSIAATKSATVAAAPVRFQKPALRARDLWPPGRHRVYLSVTTLCRCPAGPPTLASHATAHHLASHVRRRFGH